VYETIGAPDVEVVTVSETVSGDGAVEFGATGMTIDFSGSTGRMSSAPRHRTRCGSRPRPADALVPAGRLACSARVPSVFDPLLPIGMPLAVSVAIPLHFLGVRKGTCVRHRVPVQSTGEGVVDSPTQRLGDGIYRPNRPILTEQPIFGGRCFTSA